MRDVLNKAARIQLVIFDVDGVLTDGRLYLANDGNEFKAFHIRDGHGIKMLLDVGVEIAIISGRHAASVERRMKDLGIRHACLGVDDKRVVFNNLLMQLNLTADQVAYVGDDLIDLPVMTQVGLAIAVQDADPFVRQHAHWQTPSRGGRGAAREVCELLLEARGQLAAARSRYL
ncbi:MAG: 3-deoxy-manno-octulosonate-8-phosphatase KdsC [Candidatus Competibacteraceae bacterium]|nr:3-deoxy-manno-octulosonate-8-phosphatase KdsC [Candidatus Competibacteraceae bacterium]MCB1821570.1 3-deoxy-manno-octulosonate-8-phosphatase KdsC [Candidatus Competibacteraceae bacterium]MCP5127144.1 3-deoxy-manno-octulosonate-8-phosphatase KdsC [Gammaproteobacteria bacterium]HRX69741.1 3-deoxy-manno-octulosonate-8-phosphatase KdsC [Candidatus Competibacteraceae bacterium]